jgi:hypothetical protein
MFNDGALFPCGRPFTRVPVVIVVVDDAASDVVTPSDRRQGQVCVHAAQDRMPGGMS